MTTSHRTGFATEAGPFADDVAGLRAHLAARLQEPDFQAFRDFHLEDVAEEIRATAPLVRLLYDDGAGRYGYPVEAGGLGGDVRHMATMYDELSAAGLPIPAQYNLMTTLAPPMVHFAPELARKYLPEFLSGQLWWGQGFSEPEAGSDLASLRCRATKVDGGWKLNGQKLWTSHGETASRMMVLARTGTTESRHRGLSMVFVDVGPGVTVRPIRLASGRAELAEVFYDDAFLPDENVIGPVDGGWGVAMYLLQFERAVYAWQRSAALLQRLRALATQVEHTEQAERIIGSAYLDLIAVRSRSVHSVRRLAAGQVLGPEASADKIMLGAVEQAVTNAAKTLLGPVFAGGTGHDVQLWRDEWWFSRTTTIYGGSAEVQKGILADRVLKLPT